MSEDNELDEVVQEFLVESYENLDQVERDLVTLEESPEDLELLGRIFRTVHTIKGTCGFLGYSKLEGIAHIGENLLSRLRDGALTLNGDRTTALLRMSDAIREILSSIESTREEGAGEYGELLELLGRMLEDSPQPSSPPAAEPRGAMPSESEPESSSASASGSEPPSMAVVDRPSDAADPPSVPPLGELFVREGIAEKEAIDAALEAQEKGDPRKIGEILVRRGQARPKEVEAALVAQQEAKEIATIAESSVRVPVGLLDKLMNLVGELVLARNQVLQYTHTIDDPGFLATSQRLNLVTTELQEHVMQTRMQPIGNVWSKLPRVVRDLAKSFGKKVRLQMEGKETELDKTLVEAIKDPLTHLVRNAVDHGIEDPANRIAAGKDEEGTLLLRAFHEGGQVIIEITDDGGGIEPAKLREKAVQKGMMGHEAAARLSDREAMNLIFSPGFSTAAMVTNVSGRGVGMDVVRTNIERIGGTVDVQSESGKGTSFRVKIPLTLAIIPALIVRSEGERFAIPQVSLLELVRLEAEQVSANIERIHGAPVYRLRGNLLPLVDLRDALQQRSPAQAQAALSSEAVNIVVLQADDRPFGLIVEDVHDTEEIVVKPLGKQIKAVSAFAGATIMGDGRVALILDVLGLAQRAHVITSHEQHQGPRTASNSDEQSQRQTLLLFEVGSRPLAIPLQLVSRLEEFPKAQIERTGTCQVVQYRGAILPLVALSSAVSGLGHAMTDVIANELEQVIVYGDGARQVGLVVDRILDVVHEELAINAIGRRSGVVGSAVIQGRVIEIVDVEGVVAQSGVRPQGASNIQLGGAS
ncbi:MAG: chemotaxis protein CheW [Myxococcales bacterium]|nr:chemotaxis protein CheW [Myxococcales bacterium]